MFYDGVPCCFNNDIVPIMLYGDTGHRHDQECSDDLIYYARSHHPKEARCRQIPGLPLTMLPMVRDIQVSTI